MRNKFELGNKVYFKDDILLSLDNGVCSFMEYTVVSKFFVHKEEQKVEVTSNLERHLGYRLGCSTASKLTNIDNLIHSDVVANYLLMFMNTCNCFIQQNNLDMKAYYAKRRDAQMNGGFKVGERSSNDNDEDECNIDDEEFDRVYGRINNEVEESPENYINGGSYYE